MEENKRKTNREKCETYSSYKKKYQFFGKARTNSTDSYVIDDEYLIINDSQQKSTVKNNARVHNSSKNNDKLTKKSLSIKIAKTSSSKSKKSSSTISSHKSSSQVIVQQQQRPSEQSRTSSGKRKSSSRQRTSPQLKLKLKTLEIILKDLCSEKNLQDLLKQNSIAKLGSDSFKLIKKLKQKRKILIERQKLLNDNQNQKVNKLVIKTSLLPQIQTDIKTKKSKKSGAVNTTSTPEVASSVSSVKSKKDNYSKELKLLLDTNLSIGVESSSRRTSASSRNQFPEKPKQSNSKSNKQEAPQPIFPSPRLVVPKVILKTKPVFKKPQVLSPKLITNGLNKKQVKSDEKQFKQFQCKHLNLTLPKIDKIYKMDIAAGQKTVNINQEQAKNEQKARSPSPPKPRIKVKPIELLKNDKYKLKIKMKPSGGSSSKKDKVSPPKEVTQSKVLSSKEGGKSEPNRKKDDKPREHISKDHSKTSKEHSKTSKDHSKTSKDHSKTSKEHSKSSKEHYKSSKEHSKSSKEHSKSSKEHNKYSKGHSKSSKDSHKKHSEEVSLHIPPHLQHKPSDLLQDSLGLLTPLRIEEPGVGSPGSLLVPMKSVKIKPPSSSSKKKSLPPFLTNVKSSSKSKLVFEGTSSKSKHSSSSSSSKKDKLPVSSSSKSKVESQSKKGREQQNMKRRLRNTAVSLEETTSHSKEGGKSGSKKNKPDSEDEFWSPFEYVEVRSMKAPPTFIEEVLPLSTIVPQPPQEVVVAPPPVPIPPAVQIPAAVQISAPNDLILENTVPNIMVEVQPLHEIIQTITTSSGGRSNANAKRKVKYPTNRDIKRVRFCDEITVLNKGKKKRARNRGNATPAQMMPNTIIGDSENCGEIGEIQIQSVWGNADTIEQPILPHHEDLPEEDDFVLSPAAPDDDEDDDSFEPEPDIPEPVPERRLRNAKKINYSDDSSSFLDELLDSQILFDTPRQTRSESAKASKQKTKEFSQEEEITKTPESNEEDVSKTTETAISDDKIPEKSSITDESTTKDDVVVQDCAVSSSSSTNESSTGGSSSVEPIKLKLKIKTPKKKKSSEKDKEKEKEKDDKVVKKKNKKKDKESDEKKPEKKQPLPKLKIENINKNGETKLVIKKVTNSSDTSEKTDKTEDSSPKPGEKLERPKTKGELKGDVTQKTIKRGPKPKIPPSTNQSKFDKLLNSPTKSIKKDSFEKKEKPPPSNASINPIVPPPKPKTPPPPPKPKEPKVVNAETIAQFFATNIKKLSELNKNCNWGGIYEQAAYYFFDTTITYYRHYLFNYWKNNCDGIQTILIPKLRPDQLDLNINVDNLFNAVAPEEDHSNSVSYHHRGPGSANRVEKIIKKPQPPAPTVSTPNETAPPLKSPVAVVQKPEQKKLGEEENSPKITFQNSPLNLADSKQIEKDTASSTITSGSAVLQVPEVNKYSTLTNFYNNAPSMLAENTSTVVARTQEDSTSTPNIVVPQYVKSAPQTIIPTMATMPLPKSSPYEMKSSQSLGASSEGLKFVVTNVEHIQKDSRQSYPSYGQKQEVPKYASYVKSPPPAELSRSAASTPKPTHYSTSTTPKPNYSSYSKSIESTILKYDTPHQQLQQPKVQPPSEPAKTYNLQQTQQQNIETVSRPDRAKSIDMYADHLQRNIPSPFLKSAPQQQVSTQNYYSNSSTLDTTSSSDRNRLNYFNYNQPHQTTSQSSTTASSGSGGLQQLAKSYVAAAAAAVASSSTPSKSNFYYDMSKTYSPFRSTETPTSIDHQVQHHHQQQHRQSPIVKPIEKEVKDERNIPSTHSTMQSPPPSSVPTGTTSSTQKLNTDYSILPLSSTSSTTASATSDRPSIMSLDFQQSYLLNNYYNSYSLQRQLESSGFLGTTSNLLLPSVSATDNLFATEDVQQYQQHATSGHGGSNVTGQSTNHHHQLYDNYMINSTDSTILLPQDASSMQIQQSDTTNSNYADTYSPTLLTTLNNASTDYHQDSNSSYWNEKKSPASSTASTPQPDQKSSSQQKDKTKQYAHAGARALASRYDETAKNILTLHLEHVRLFTADCKFAKNYSTYLKEQIRLKYPYCHPLIGNTRLNKLGSAKVYVHCMDKDCLRFNCTLQSNIVDSVGLTPVEIKVYGELNQDKQKQLCRMTSQQPQQQQPQHLNTERLMVE